jgi:molybdate-binding protein
MDMEMDRLGIDPGHVTSGGVLSLGHMDTALLIRFGQADAGFGIEAAARLTGCDFLPVRMEQFDLIIRKENFFLPRIQELLSLLREEVFVALAESLAGYDLQETGKIKNV